MRSDAQDAAFLWDMLKAAKTVQEFVAGLSYETYVESVLHRSAVERQIEIIGEAARRVSRDFQRAQPQIPWQKIVAQRHVLAHEYGELEHERVWRVATIHTLELIDQLEPLVPLPPEADECQ